MGLIPGLRVDVGKQPRFPISGGFTQWLIVHVVKGNTALLLHGGRRRRNEQGVHRANGPVGGVAVGEEIRWREMLLRSVDRIRGHSGRNGGRRNAILSLVVTTQVWERGRIVDSTAHGGRNGSRRHLLRPVGSPIVNWRHESRHRQLRDCIGRERLRHRV